MKAVIQRVSRGNVSIDGETTGAIRQGFVVLLGVAEGDEQADAEYLVEKISNLRVFEDPGGKMNLSIGDIGGSMLVISQFTLLADCRKGRRPSFVGAAGQETANELYTYFIQQMQARQIPVETGRFGARMTVSIENDGPVTIIIDSRDK